VLIRDAPPYDECPGGKHGHESAEAGYPPGGFAACGEHVPRSAYGFSEQAADNENAGNVECEYDIVWHSHEWIPAFSEEPAIVSIIACAAVFLPAVNRTVAVCAAPVPDARLLSNTLTSGQGAESAFSLAIISASCIIIHTQFI
jgi:hypothetical protein